MSTDTERKFGLDQNAGNIIPDLGRAVQYINLKLAALGYPIYGDKSNSEFVQLTQALLDNHQEKNRLLVNYPCPADRRIQEFLNDYLAENGVKNNIKLPTNTFILDRHGLARTLSVPPDKDSFETDIVKSYRVQQGVLHNPKHDRRTTQNSFHIVKGGFAIPNDKIAVPKNVFAKMLESAMNPPEDILRLPFTSTQEEEAKLFVSLLLRPTVCPEVPGITPVKSLEIRFIAPGSLVSNLDFVESIFGNAGDPYLPENDAALDSEHWTGHSGCVILAPQLITLKKKDLGLPHYDQASERERMNGMCWKTDDELYNDGNAFKVTCRDHRGIMVTLIADNYFGYCKKEVKTQIGFSSNLYGLTEEEHAGGALAFPGYDLGEKFLLDETLARNTTKFENLTKLCGSIMEIRPEGYGIDKKHPHILYVPEDSVFDINKQSITWTKNGEQQKIKLWAFHTYIFPSGYKVHMEKQPGGPNWRLIGTVAEGTFCHKPCTVSGGGKSEISKSIMDAMIQGPVFVSDFHEDMDLVAGIMSRDFGDRFREKFSEKRPSRPILSVERSLGSVIKLFTPSSEFADDYNLWLNSIPHHIKEIIFIVKRHYQTEWGQNWRDHFSVDMINGYLGHELKYNDSPLVANYLRVGYEEDGSRRIYKLRQDFQPAKKIQMEDDITASTVVPSEQLSGLNPEYHNPSVKLAVNCETRLFQRPDDAIYRGYDKQAELDLASPDTFLSNYQPLSKQDAKDLIQDAVNFDLYTDAIKKMIRDFVDNPEDTYCVSSSHPRIVDGKPSKNPRYLQTRPDLVASEDKYIADVAVRFRRKLEVEKPIYHPVNAVLSGRRNNPPDEKLGVLPLAVYNPIHYQELPELFMDFICSVTGKSPSTTGFGSEGALTKGPFNALWPTTDLNNALVSYMVTGYDGFSSAAGYVGPKIRVDHDISLLVPEIWCRMSVEERDPKFLIENGYLERVDNFEHAGKTVNASILGFRITIRFVHAFLGRIFNNPNAVFSEEMLKPETQDMDIFVDGLSNILATQKRVAENYFQDGSVEAACPPLKALLHIMKDGTYEGKDLSHPDIRKMFTREYLLSSDWYGARLKTKQERQIKLWETHVASLKKFLNKPSYSEYVMKLGINDRLAKAKQKLAKVSSPDYLKALVGTIGAEPCIGDDVAKNTSQPSLKS